MLIITILWIAVIALTLLLKKLLNIKLNTFICLCMTIFIVFFAANINECIQAALNGCRLWYKAMVPTTFPFLVICNILIAYDGINIYSKFLGPIICRPLSLSKNCSFPIAASFLCGYPLGAKYCVDTYNMGYIEKKEYSRLVNIASNVSPLFLIGSVGSAMLNNLTFGYILLAASYLSCIVMGFLTKKKRTNSSVSSPNKNNISKNFGIVLKESIQNSLITILNIGGFIVLFSIVISLVKNFESLHAFVHMIELFLHIPEDTLYSVLLGSIEITNGCSVLVPLSISVPLKLSLISFLCSFSGLGIIAQVISFIGDTPIKISKYIMLKFIQGIISFFITYGIVLLIPSSFTASSINIDTPGSGLSLISCLIPSAAVLASILIFKLIDKKFLSKKIKEA